MRQRFASLVMGLAWTFAAGVGASEALAPPRDAVLAEVGDQAIRYSQLNVMLNSSAVVGLSVPVLGSPERRTAMLTLLDKAISANLLYLDALRQGRDGDPSYQADLRRFSDALLGSLYKSEHLYAGITVSAEEVEAFHRDAVDPTAKLDEPLRAAIEARLRKAKLAELRKTQRQRLREGVRVEVDESVLSSKGDMARNDADVVARLDDEPVTWGEVKARMAVATRRSELAPFYIDEPDERERRLNEYLDSRLLATKGRAAGLESHPTYRLRVGEYRKTRLINLHRGELLAGWEPEELELVAFFDEHKGRISTQEMRKVQMVVVEARDEAEALKQRIEAGDLSLHQAALEYSIDPNAKQTLGEIGWVAEGSGFPELDRLTFSVDPDVLSGPVESPAGWHLLKVLEVRDAQHQFLTDPGTRKVTRRLYLHDRLDEYLVGLRQETFPVVVHQDEVNRVFQEEARWIAALEQKASEHPEAGQKRLEELQRIFNTPDLEVRRQ